MKAHRSRILVVGCARSGTTLLQAMLSAHAEIVSFPESQFFANIVDQYDSRVMGDSRSFSKKGLYLFQDLLLSLGLSPRPYSGVCAINRFIDKTNMNHAPVALGANKLFLRSQIDIMTELLDHAALEADKKAWLLKTPSNISYIDVIQKYVEGAKFIHIVRPGKDVVASIFDAAIKHPDTVWKSHFYRGSLMRLANMWNASIRQTLKYIEQDNHIAVSYEKLVENPEQELSRIFSFIGIEDDASCSVRYSEQASGIVAGNEKWKKGVSGKIEKIDKYEKVFNEEQKSILESAIDTVDIQRIA